MSRYLASNFIPPFIMGAVFFVCFLLTTQLFRVIPLISNKSVSISIVMEMMMHIAISFLPGAIPISALFATIYTLGKLSDDSEIVAMRSFGMTKEKILMPFLIIGAVIAVSVFSLNRSIIPYSQNRFNEIFVKLTSKGALSNITAENFYTEIPGVILFAKEVEKDGTIMRDLFINQKTAAGERTIHARRGALIKQSGGEMQLPTARLHLNDGNLVTMDKEGKVEKILFEEYDFPIISGGSKISMMTKDGMLSNNYLSKVIEEKKTSLQKLKDAKSSNRDILNLVNSLAKSQIEYWSRFNTPIQTLMFIFLGVSLGVKRSRGKGRNTAGVGMVVLFSYYIIFFLGIALAKKGSLPASMVVFIPTVILFAVAYKQYQKLDWAS